MAGFAAALLLNAPPVSAQDFALTLPVDCTLGEDCYIQQYVDRDPGPGVLDFGCGTLANDGHKGTDFAVPTERDMARGMDVIAAAPGTVLGIRDGMADVRQGAPDAPDIAGRECGNGVVIDHGGGWQTQYCHLRRGSIAVARGDAVARGERLGLVGMSGAASFPHLHLSVRRDGAVVDPFRPQGGLSCGAPNGSLWSAPISYDPGGLIDAGLIDRVPSLAAIQAGLPEDSLPEAAPGAMVLWGYVANGQAGDVIAFAIDGPEGAFGRHEAVLERGQPFLFRAWGRRAPEAGLPAGVWRGTVVHRRGAEVLDRMEVSSTVRD